MVNIKINGKPVEVQEGKTILEAARENNIHIPTLCYLKDLNQIGACRMCLVEIKGARALQAACVYPVSEGLEIYTNSAKVRNARKATLELILSNHERKCLTCIRNRNCELQKLCEELGIEDIRYEGKNIEYELDTSSPSLVRDNNKCILCRRCVAACKNQGISVIDCVERGFNTHIAPYFEKPINDAACIYCGQCIVACPVGALYEKNDIPQVNEAIDDSEKHVVVQVAPAVRAALGEEFGLPIGTPVTGKMVAALKRLGFDKVFDTDTGADLTIMEEGTEFIERFTKGENLPIITSCSPGWVKYCEHNYPEFLPNLSTCKSPMEMFAAMAKSYYAEKEGINKDKIFSVAVMPCTSKKFEASRSEHTTSGGRDIDVSLTTRELARMIKQAGIDFVNLPDEQFDTPFGEATGAGVIFGVTGGVTEAVIRRVSTDKSLASLRNLAFEGVRGFEGIKELEVPLGDKAIKVCVVNGLRNVEVIMNRMKAGEHFDLIEVMACPNGCIGGAGQPKATIDEKKERSVNLYNADKLCTLKRSEENPLMDKLYEGILKGREHELLHVSYVK